MPKSFLKIAHAALACLMCFEFLSGLDTAQVEKGIGHLLTRKYTLTLTSKCVCLLSLARSPLAGIRPHFI